MHLFTAHSEAQLYTLYVIEYRAIYPVPAMGIFYLQFSRWRRCYKSRGSFPGYLASEVQKRSNAPVPGQKLVTKVSKSHAIPRYVPGVSPPGWPLISA